MFFGGNTRARTKDPLIRGWRDGGATLEQLVRLYLSSTRALLRAAGLPEDAAQHVLEGIFRGSATVEREWAVLLARRGSGHPCLTDDLPSLVGDLARVTPLLGRSTAGVETLEATVAAMRLAGDVSLRFDMPPIAYNFFEIAWHIGAIFDRAALDIAERMREFSDRDNVDQYHGAIWRLAIERLRYAFDRESDYVPALDAVELALTCLVLNAGLQNDLFARLRAQIGRGRGTRVDDLVAIVTVQAPAVALDADKRRMAQRALAELRLGDRASRLHLLEVEVFALAEAQAMLDDLRLTLTPDEKVEPQIDWHDLRYRDSRLARAVPVGRSLIADPERSAVLLLDLAHEIGHAMALQGPIGARPVISTSSVTCKSAPSSRLGKQRWAGGSNRQLPLGCSSPPAWLAYSNSMAGWSRSPRSRSMRCGSAIVDG